MRSFDDIRARAREVRTACASHPGGLLAGLEAYIEERHEVALAPAHPNRMGGSNAEVEGDILRYDERLDLTPADLLYQLAHETGHLEFHPRVKRRSYEANPIAAAIYLRQQDVGAVAAYSQKLPEEVEATAFANEFVCPTDEVLARWRAGAGVSIEELALHFEAPRGLVVVQLAEALYREALGSARSAEAKPPRPPRQDDAQDRGVFYTDGPALIHAGPGTGKTRTLVRHAVHILTTSGTKGDNLLMLTFSSEAAEELRSRIGHALTANPELSSDRVTVFTFHGFGLYLIHLFYEQLGFEKPPAVLDEAGQQELLLASFGVAATRTLFSLKDPEGAAETAADHINHLKQRLRTPDLLRAKVDELEAEAKAAGEAFDGAHSRELARLWEAYETAKEAAGRVDFADLIALPIRLLQSDPDTAKLVREQFQRALVDEYQDVSAATGALLRAVCLDAEGRVVVPAWVVGDDRQAIFAFLGADRTNVTGFEEAFPGARTFALDQSYRSCEPVVTAANQLATLMTDPAHKGAAYTEFWKPDSEVLPFGPNPVRLAAAPSDAAEREGVADLVAGWIREGAAYEDVAVLARRNVDVREIALALGRRGIPVTTSGIVTAEGAAGDLAAALTLADDPASALPRLAYALGPESLSLAQRNAVVARALDLIAAGEPLATFPNGLLGDEAELAAELVAAHVQMEAGRYRADGFDAVVTFLFEASTYLRRLLDRHDAAVATSDAVEQAETSLALAEVATALGRAAAYRFAHPAVPARQSRRQFAAFFRRVLTGSAPSAVAPRRTPGLVQVMTCHASKGLEFPLVVVAGQRLPANPRGLPWLPTRLRPPVSEDLAQADALLFVGLTRAERAVAVSYARSAGGTGRPSKIPELLQRWQDEFGLDVEEWPDVPAARPEVEMGPVWGAPRDESVRTRALAKPKESCALRAYAEHGLGLSFPTPAPSLYGFFVGRMRALIEAIVREAHGREAPLGRDDALALLDEHWPPPGLDDHVHVALFAAAARDTAMNFAEAFALAGPPLAPRFEPLDLEAVAAEYGLGLRFGLAAHFRDGQGRPSGIVFHPGSLRKHLSAKGDGVLWGATPLEEDRVALTLLRSYYDDGSDPFMPLVFSHADGTLYPFLWPQARFYNAERDRVLSKVEAFGQRRYEHVVDDGQCDRCRTRISCPHRIGAVPPATETTIG